MNDRQRSPPAPPGAVGTACAGGANFAWTTILFVAVRQVEENLPRLLPQKPLANAPPVVVLLSAAAGSSAPRRSRWSPLSGVRKLYVRQILGNPVEVPGEDAKT